MSTEKLGSAAVVDANGHLTAYPHQRSQDGQLTLQVHVDSAVTLGFVFRSLKASSQLKVISMLPIQRDEVEVVIDLSTSERAFSFLIQLDMAFSLAEGRVTTTDWPY